MKILAIETSCDETSVAVVEDGNKLLSLVINSQIDTHKAFGGVVPEIAARSHIEVMLPVVTQALAEAFVSSKSEASNSKQTQNTNDQSSKTPTSNFQLPTSKHWDQIDAIAVTQGPGLSGSLLIGVLTARTLAWAFKKPLYPVHHILGHVYANWLISGECLVNSDQNKLSATHQSLPTSTPEFPVLALIVSGGHTQLMLGTDHENWRVIGRTQDDAVGEAFDKVAKVLGLPYPGGPSVAKVAENGDSTKFALPTPKADTIDPGLATLRLEIEEQGSKILQSSPDCHPELSSRSTTVVSEISDLSSTRSRHSQLDWKSSENEIAGSDTKSNWIPDRVGDDKPGSSLNFSFSGLKTAVLRAVQKECGKTHEFPSFELAALLSDAQKADFAASFQSKAIDYLVSKTKAAYDEFKPKTVIIGGGVAASLPLRTALSDQIPIDINYAPQILCTDNAAMIGARAYFQSLTSDPIDPNDLEIKPSWPL